MGCFYECPDSRRIRVISIADSKHQGGDLCTAAHYVLTPGFEMKAFIGGGRREILEMIDACGDEKSKKIKLIPITEKNKAVSLIIREAEAEDTRPLYVCIWGKLDIIAKAYKMKPECFKNVTIIWADSGEEKETAKAFIEQSNMPFWHICPKACQKIRVTAAQLKRKISDLGAVGSNLYKKAALLCSDEYAKNSGEVLVLESEAAIAALLAPQEYAYQIEAVGTRLVRNYTTIDSRFVMEDFYGKLVQISKKYK